MSDKVKLARYRNTSYFVGYTGDGGLKQFTWSGSKNGKAEIKEVPRDVVDWLTMNSVCFDKGELVIVDEDDSTKQIKESIVDAEAYTNNTHTKEEISKMIKTGNIAQMKISLKRLQLTQKNSLLLMLLLNSVMISLLENLKP